VLRDARARPEFQSAEDEAKEQRISQLVLPNLVYRRNYSLD
jgi:outer membrane protein insertion porin family